VPIEQTRVATKDGACPVQVMTPAGDGPWPAVIFYMDAGGIRPAMTDMAQRLADAGYVVLLPDMFYRFGPYAPLVPKDVFAGDFRAILGPMIVTTGNDKAAADTGSFLTYLSSRGDVAGTAVGAVGFCMGGGMALTAAATYPNRFAAVASFHGGNLATDLQTSPHLLAPKLQAEVYIAAASNDAGYPPAMAERLEDVLRTAGVRYSTETYPAAHGWMMPDFPVYDHAAAEHGWEEMLALFARQLP
jgi:carboxymethylenebutenolidase